MYILHQRYLIYNIFFFILDCIPRAESFSDANHQSQERTSLQVAGGTFVRKNHLFFLESPVLTDPQLLKVGKKGSKMCMRIDYIHIKSSIMLNQKLQQTKFFRQQFKKILQSETSSCTFCYPFHQLPIAVRPHS